LWKINKENVGPNYMAVLGKLESKLDVANIYKDVPEWMAYKSLLDGYKMDRLLLSKQIEKIKKELSET